MGDWTDPARPWTGPAYPDAAPGSAKDAVGNPAVNISGTSWRPVTPLDAAAALAEHVGHQPRLIVVDSRGRILPFDRECNFTQPRSGTLEIEKDGVTVGVFAAGGWIYVGQG